MTNEDKESSTSGAWDGFDPTKWLERLQIPNPDMSQLAEAARKDFEAVQKANQITMEGWQAVAQKQAELFQEAAKRWQERMTDTLGNSQQQDAGEQTEFFRTELEAAVSNMRELAEQAAKSQSDATELIRQRFEENMQSFFKPKS